MLVIDDELKPDVAVQKVKGLIDREKVDVVAGVVFSNVMMAIQKPVLENETFLVSGNAGPSPLAGKGCSPYFFSASYQNDQVHEVIRQICPGPGLQAGVPDRPPTTRRARMRMAGFKHSYKGEVVNEIFTPLGQLDFSAELAQDRRRPAGRAVSCLHARRHGGQSGEAVSSQAGLESTIPVPVRLHRGRDHAAGPPRMRPLACSPGAEWAPNIDTPENKAFVAAFEKEYGVVPSLYAAQGYDAAKLIDGALKATGGKVSDKPAFRKALASAPFTSVRGSFAFNTNGFPIQDFYVVKAVKRADGKFEDGGAGEGVHQGQGFLCRRLPAEVSLRPRPHHP